MDQVDIDNIDAFASPEHARWGLGTHMFDVTNLNRIIASYGPNGIGLPIHLLTHPTYDHNLNSWEKWRLVYESGERFVQEYVIKFSNRESNRDFNRRKQITPIAAFAGAAIDEIKNSIFQRIGDTTRTGGPISYQKAIDGLTGGVDLKGSTINWFVGHYVIPELLVQKKVGVYVDAPLFGVTQADKGSKHPYLIPYRAEDIRNWTMTADGSFTALLLREYRYIYDPILNLPIREIEAYRHVYISPDTGNVCIQFYDWTGNLASNLIELQIKKIPFAVGELTKSLMKDVATHQIALTNMESSDISYILKSNFPLYTEQYDSKNSSQYIRTAQSAYEQFYGTTVESATGSSPPRQNVGENMDAGPSAGRRYPIGAERPGFIAPPSDPIRVSMEKQRTLKDDVRALVHLALASVQASAESKKVDRQQGLESGLAAIGLELEHMEIQISEFWALYEGSSPAVVIYPDHWAIKSIDEITKELESWSDLRDSIPSPTFKTEVNKIIAEQVIGTRVAPDVLAKIKVELEKAKGGSSDPKTINIDVENGILSAATASTLRGYPDGEVDAAQKEHSARLASIALAQSSGKALTAVATSSAENDLKSEQLTNAAGRGVPDLSASPAADAATEKLNKAGRGQAQ